MLSMDINNVIPLSYNVADGKKKYVLFCGAGISKDAGVPTGWDILLQTLRVIRSQEEKQSTEYSDTDMEKYYKEKYKDKTYSEVIEALFPSIEEQRDFLKNQFADITPGKTHELIAQWVKEGLIRFIITTNFDTLLEQALDKADLRGKYSVISSGKEILTSKPWNIVECCRIYKIHGTIDQGKIRNTEKDLLRLENKLQKEILDIIERHGVIVLGYAGNKEDKAVMDIFSKRRFKGYTLFWCVRNGCNDGVQALIEKQDGRLIKINSASDFLEDVLTRVEVARKENDQPSEEILLLKFKKILASDSDVKIKQLIDDEKTKLIECVKDALNDIDEKDNTSLWDGYVRIFNSLKSFLLLTDQIVKYKEEYWGRLIPVFTNIHSLNYSQDRNGKGGIINYLHYTLLEIVGGILVENRSFKCLHELLKVKKLNLMRIDTEKAEHILDWNIQARFIEEKNEASGRMHKSECPKMQYLLQLIDSQKVLLGFNVKNRILEADLLYFVYSINYPIGRDYWYPQSLAYRLSSSSNIFNLIKYDEEFGRRIAKELFEMEYSNFIGLLNKAKKYIGEVRNTLYCSTENPLRDF